MRIDEFFEKYPQNIFGFRINGDIKIIDFWLPNNWDITQNFDDCTLKKQKDDESGKRSYYIIFSNVVNFENLFKNVSDIIEHNLEIEKKQMLFAEKVGELKKLFTTLTYDELKVIQFDAPLSLVPENPRLVKPELVTEEGVETINEN